MEFGRNLLVDQKIAFFGENVYILYAVNMVWDLMVGWRGGISPPRSHRSGREPLGSSGSYRPALA
jgi:hypothetical protein